MDENTFRVTCPHCGETLEIYIEPDVEGSLIQDCEVCCNPWQVQVFQGERRRRVRVSRLDGSDQ